MPRSSQNITDSAGLSERDRQILKDIILTYIVSAEPVSSRTISKHSRLGLSSATIRNTMADLEEMGYLTHPHTSAGRVPTREGYHLFINSLMDSQSVSRRERRYIQGSLKDQVDSEALMKATGTLLSELSHQVSVVLTPQLETTVLKAVEFLPLTGSRLLCVVVSTTGFVDNKVVEVEETPSREDLLWISNYLTENFSGRTMLEIRDTLLALMAEERARMDRLLRLSIELGRRGLGPGSEQNLVVEGTNEILGYPELGNVSTIRQVFETFSQKARLVQLLNGCMSGSGVRVLIGEDSEVTSELDFSLITTGYGVSGRLLGSVGILGPSRMEYQRLVPLVHYLGESLTHALSEGYYETESDDD